jgi:hypothetical protein
MTNVVDSAVPGGCSGRATLRRRHCYMLGYLGNMTSAPCCVTMGNAALLRFLSNTTIEMEGLLTSGIDYERNN